MDVAYDIKNIGNPCLVNANKLNSRSISSNLKRFVCIACGEYVAFVHDIDGTKYFRHRDKSKSGKDCEKRIESGLTSQNYYEMKGSPLYIKEYDDGIFKLFISFSGLGVALHDHLKKYEASIFICGKNNENRKLSLDSYNFNVEESTLIEVDFLPENNSYKFKYEVSNKNTPIQLKKKWSDFSDFLSDSGAIFNMNESAGRKIPKGGFLYSNTPYLYVTDKKIQNCVGLQTNRIGRLILENKEYKVYQIIYEESENSIEYFSKDFCETGLNLIYKSKKPQLVPLWPPYISLNDECSVINNSDTFYFLMKLYDRNTDLIKNTGKSSEEIDLTTLNESTFIADISINKYNTSISINSFSNEQELIINNRVKLLDYCDPEVIIYENDKEETETLQCGKAYNIKSNIDIEIFSIENLTDIRNLSSVRIDNEHIFPCKTDLWGHSNGFFFKVRSVVANKKNINSFAFTDLSLYKELKKYEKTKHIYFDNIDKLISYLYDYPISFRYAKKLITKKEIPVGIQKILIEIGGKKYGK